MNTDRALWFAAQSAPAIPTRRRWLPDEIESLEALVGKVRPSVMAKRLGRTLNSIKSKLMCLGYIISSDVTAPLGLSAIGLARRLSIPYEVVWRTVRSGEIPASREGGKDYLIVWRDVRRYKRTMQRRQRRRDRALSRIKEESITKPEFERLLGFSETHSQRYLVGRIVRAWKIPAMWTDVGSQRWEWRVSLADAKRVKALRESGGLRLNTKTYRSLQAKTNAEVTALRRQRRLGHRDDLGRPRSAIVPGCFTVAQVASHVGLSETQVYEHVRLERLPVLRRRVGRRIFISVEPKALTAYIQWTRREKLHTGPLRPRHRQIAQVHAAGRITLTEAAQKYSLPRTTLYDVVQRGLVHSRIIAGLHAVRTQDVRYFARRYHHKGRGRPTCLPSP